MGKTKCKKREKVKLSLDMVWADVTAHNLASSILIAISNTYVIGKRLLSSRLIYANCLASTKNCIRVAARYQIMSGSFLLPVQQFPTPDFLFDGGYYFVIFFRITNLMWQRAPGASYVYVKSDLNNGSKSASLKRKLVDYNSILYKLTILSTGVVGHLQNLKV